MLGLTVSYASDDEEIRITLSGNNGASGNITIEVEEYRVDSFKLKAIDLDPNTRYSVFLTESPVPGALPAQFLGEFTSNSKGRGKFKVKTDFSRLMLLPPQINQSKMIWV
ncbi:MAG: hypothetical protein L3J75_03040 [Methylococcaceae bacterium]|nr:hypothetical protein [Methylococcaceae bacterium]